MGPRGDAIAEFDWSVGQILETLDRLGIAENTLIILSSDNGPVVDDGYQDQAVERLGDHKPAGALRGGKYSAFEAGTRVPFLVRWPGQAKPGVSEALVSQIDLMGTLSQLSGQPIPDQAAPDSFNALDTWLGKSEKSRDYVVLQSTGTMSLVQENWKYITPSKAARYNRFTNTELGNDTVPQLYNLTTDVGEQVNVALENSEVVQQLAAKLQELKATERTR